MTAEAPAAAAQRFDANNDGIMEPYSLGEYVLYDDYVNLQQQLATSEREREALRADAEWLLFGRTVFRKGNG